MFKILGIAVKAEAVPCSGFCLPGNYTEIGTCCIGPNTKILSRYLKKNETLLINTYNSIY